MQVPNRNLLIKSSISLIHSAGGWLFGQIFPLKKSDQEKNSLRPLRLCGEN
jgi:hypothetical protein